MFNIIKGDYMKNIFGEFGLIQTIGKYLPKVTIEAPKRKLFSLPIDKQSRLEILEILENKEYLQSKKEINQLKSDSNAEIKIKVKAIRVKDEL